MVLSCRAGSDCAAAFDAVAAFARTCEERYGAPQETAFSELLSYAFMRTYRLTIMPPPYGSYL